HLQDVYERHAGMHHDVSATYHPAEMVAERHRLAIAATDVDGTTFYVGDYDYAFPLQSLCKVFTYGMVLEQLGREETLRHVGVKPSADAFFAYAFDERYNRPFNPMVNAGALVVINILKGKDRAEKVESILKTLRAYAGNPDLK